MKTIRLKVLIPILVLAFICIAYSGWNIASMKSLKKSSIQNSESNSVYYIIYTGKEKNQPVVDEKFSMILNGAWM